MKHAQPKEFLLRRAKQPEHITLSMVYDESSKQDPEAMLIEKDLLAPMFDLMAKPTYYVKTSRIDAELHDFNDALARYYELVRNWKSTEDYVQPVIFRWHDRWTEGVPPSEDGP